MSRSSPLLTITLSSRTRDGVGRSANLLSIALFLSLCFAPALARWVGVLGRLPDLVIGVIAAAVAWQLIDKRRATFVPLRYIAVFLLFLYVTAAGVVLNEVSPLVVVAGVRSYFKYVPLFLMPFAFRFSKSDLRLQFAVLVGLALLQLPVTLWQRFVEYAHIATGDGVSGTLASSNSVTILLVAMVVVLVAFYIKRRLSLSAFVILSLLVFLPSTLNETKVTVFILPLGIGAVMVLVRRELGFRNLLFLSLAGVALLTAFTLIGNRLYYADVQGGLVTGLENGKLSGGQTTGAQAAPTALRRDRQRIVGASQQVKSEPNQFVGRLDSFQIPFRLFYDHDLTRLFLGVGIGNVYSSIGPGGAYQPIAGQLGGGITSLSILLWETGVVGTVLYLLFLLMIGRDATVVARKRDGWGALAAGWFGVTTVVVGMFVYNNMFSVPEIPGFFIYFSGLVVYRARVLRNRTDSPISEGVRTKA